jgi:hypothetical protein
MLTYSVHDGGSAFRFKLAGVLAGEDVAQFEQCWCTAPNFWRRQYGRVRS